MVSAPVTHITASTTAVLPCVMAQIGPARAPSGAAHVKCGAQSLSITAPTGTKKLNAVTTQIQYFVVALAPRIDVSNQPAQPTIYAYSRWTLK
jgi:hypothetical protein